MSKEWEWLEWVFILSDHMHTRFVDRELSEVELRIMLEDAGRIRPGTVVGRYIMECRDDRGRPWWIIVEPDEHLEQVKVVTAFMRKP